MSANRYRSLLYFLVFTFISTILFFDFFFDFSYICIVGFIPQVDQIRLSNNIHKDSSSHGLLFLVRQLKVKFEGVCIRVGLKKQVNRPKSKRWWTIMISRIVLVWKYYFLNNDNLISMFSTV